MELQPLDYVLLTIFGFLVIVGLFKGLSGWLGTIVGATSASVMGFFGFGTCRSAAAACSFVSPPLLVPAAMVLDFLGALIIFGLVRKIVARFVTFLVPQPLNAILGTAGGIVLSAVVAGVLAATAMFEGCRLTEGLVARYSCIVKMVAGLVDSGLEGKAP